LELVKEVHFDGNLHMLKVLVDASEELPCKWTKIGLLKAEDRVRKSLFKLFSGRIG